MIIRLSDHVLHTVAVCIREGASKTEAEAANGKPSEGKNGTEAPETSAAEAAHARALYNSTNEIYRGEEHTGPEQLCPPGGRARRVAQERLEEVGALRLSRVGGPPGNF